MPAQLVSLGDGPSIDLDKPVLLLGRHAECDILLNSRKISRRHCCVAEVPGGLAVRDLESTNGIRVNGEKVRDGLLRPGDELVVGNFRYRYEADGLEPPTPPRRPASEDSMLERADEPVALDEPRRKK